MLIHFHKQTTPLLRARSARGYCGQCTRWPDASKWKARVGSGVRYQAPSTASSCRPNRRTVSKPCDAVWTSRSPPRQARADPTAMPALACTRALA